MTKFAILIPAYNAARCLDRLLAEISRAQPDLPVLVVDDGSNDETADIAANHGATVLRHPSNRGKGAALLTGFRWAIEENIDAVITMDADMQHDPRELSSFLARYENDETIIVGRRSINAAMPLARRLSNTLSSFVSSLFANTRLEDAQCGFRLIPVKTLQSVPVLSSRFDLEPELLIRAARAGFTIRHIPIATLYNSESSSISPIGDTLRFLIMLVRSVFW